MSHRDEIVERAIDYPYEIPDRSFVQAGERTLALTDDARLEPRIPVLAFGSNAAPEVLIRKFELTEEGDAVPVVRAQLSDFDIVYSAHISAYGSIPAAIQLSPGTTASTYVTYLTPAQLRLMSETEPNYTLACLDSVSCRLETGEELTSVASYLSNHGCLSVEGSEAALAAAVADGRRFPQCTEREAIEYVRARLCPELTLEDFIVENAAHPALAERRTEALRQGAKPFAGASRRPSKY